MQEGVQQTNLCKLRCLNSLSIECLPQGFCSSHGLLQNFTMQCLELENENIRHYNVKKIL